MHYIRTKAMFRKAILSIITLQYIAVIFCGSYADISKDYLKIISSYLRCAELFGADDIDRNIQTAHETIDDSKSVHIVDDIWIIYDKTKVQNFKADSIFLWCDKRTESNTRARIKGLFAALECDVESDSYYDAESMWLLATEGYEQYEEALKANAEAIYNGEIVPFRINRYGYYGIGYIHGDGLCIYVI